MSEEQNQPNTDQNEQSSNTPQNTEQQKPAGARPAGARPADATSSTAGAAHTKPPESEKIKFMFSKFSPVYYKKWNGKQDTCDICRNLLTDPCNTCETSETNDPCPVVEGVCGHWFHKHCIDKWAVKQHTCPNCQSQWDVKSQFQLQ